jgi:hypothetical protein
MDIEDDITNALVANSRKAWKTPPSKQRACWHIIVDASLSRSLSENRTTTGANNKPGRAMSVSSAPHVALLSQ